MNADQLLLVLPSQAHESVNSGLTVHQWGMLVEQFRSGGGRELLLGGTEPLGYPGFWVLARKGLKAGIPRVTAYLSGSHLEPWVMRGLVESGVHVLVALDSLDPEQHEVLHGPGSHARAMAAIEAFIRQGMIQRVGLLSTATRLTREGLPLLATWASGKGLSRLLWTSVPDGGWPSEQLKALKLLPEEKTNLGRQMQAVGRTVGSMYVGPLDMLEDPSLEISCSPLLRVNAQGEACWGFSGEGGTVGNLRRSTLSDLLSRGAQAAGD